MVNIFLIAMGCVHLFVIGVIVGFNLTDRENKKKTEATEEKVHDLAKAIYILNDEYKKLYNQVNKEDKNNEN